MKKFLVVLAALFALSMFGGSWFDGHGKAHAAGVATWVRNNANGLCTSSNCRLITQNAAGGATTCNKAVDGGGSNHVSCLTASDSPAWSYIFTRYGPISPSCYYYSSVTTYQLPAFTTTTFSPYMAATNWACGGGGGAAAALSAFNASLRVPA